MTKLPTSKLRVEAEQALNNGDLKKATALASTLSQRTNAGPWDKVVVGRVSLANGDAKLAEHWFKEASAELPEEGAIFIDLALACAEQLKWKAASAALERAIAQRPSIAELHKRHGIYLSNAQAYDDAGIALERALALEPRNASVLALLGEQRLKVGRLDDAKEAFNRSIGEEPKNKVVLLNLALVCELQGDLRAALEALDRLKHVDPEDPSVLHRIGLIHLALGHLKDGWLAYAKRLKDKSYKSWQYAVRVPYWQGETISDKSLLVWTDQGLGEQILTASLMSEVSERARSTTLACDPRLVALFERSYPNIRVVSLEAMRNDGEQLGPIDVQASISELGAVLRPSIEAFPEPKPFLIPDEARVGTFREQLKADSDQRLIGISWRSANPLAGNAKSTDLINDWRPLLTQMNARFVCLQYGEVGSELGDVQAELGVEISTVSNVDFQRDIDGFTALVSAMDEVVSISNTTVHVAGGLGISTRAVLPNGYGSPWYWFEQRVASPWYADVTLYRSRGDWAETIEQIARELRGNKK